MKGITKVLMMGILVAMSIPIMSSLSFAQPDLMVASFTTTGRATIDTGRNSLTVPISITVRNQGTARSGRFPLIISITAPDGRIVWSGCSVLSNTQRDRNGNICTRSTLRARRSRVLAGTLTATISPTHLRLTRGMVISLQVVLDYPHPAEFPPECGPVSETNEDNNTSTPLRVTLD